MQNVFSVISYMLYVAAFGCFILTFEYLDRYFRDIWSSTFKASYPWLFVSQIMFPILVGILLVLPQWVTTLKQEGSWKIDWIMLLTVGLPALFFALAPIIWVLHSELLITLYHQIMTLHRGIVKVAGILFGFVLITSFSKQENKDATHN